MIVTIADDWRVRRHDRMNFVVEERVEVQPKDEDKPMRLDWKVRGYYSSIESAFSALPDHLSKSEAIETWAHLVDALEAIIRGRRAS